jgi:hypothetical protein
LPLQMINLRLKSRSYRIYNRWFPTSSVKGGFIAVSDDLWVLDIP